MRVIAFSCVHWMTRETQVEVYGYDEPLEYNPFLRLCELILDTRPDAVVNLGDFTEDAWENPTRKLPNSYARIQLGKALHKIAGNHDQYGAQFMELDGIRYEHGHKLGIPGADSSVDGYIKDLRANTAGMRIVHGHTHVPAGPWPLDVGSVTFSRTYGEIVDGVPVLKVL